MQEYINAQFDELTCGVAELKQQTPEIEKIANVCTDALRRGHKIIFCGNGGSAAQSQHLAAELVGRYKMEPSGNEFHFLDGRILRFDRTETITATTSFFPASWKVSAKAAIFL